MPKESESFNKTDNSSEMIVISPNPRIEEILVSNQPSSSGEVLSYEARLNEKLKDLDLYEEDMTIQQKEELLEVVVASWETAEKEKTRRQFFQDYMTASEAFCNDQFEFTLQESEEISNAIRNAEIQLPSDSSEANISSFSGDFEAGTVIVNGNLDLQFDTVPSTFDSSSIDRESEKTFTSVSAKSFSEEETRESKTPSSRKRRSRRGKTTSKEPLEVSVVSTDPAKETDHRESGNQLLEKGISSWKPCLSPKDTPLICSKRPMPEEKDTSSCEFTEEAYSQKVYSLVKEFDFARRETRKAYAPQWSFSKPFHLTRRGLFVKKSGKLDKYDQMIGVTEPVKSNQPNLSFTPHSINRGETSRTAESTHTGTKTLRSEMLTSQTNTPVQTTRSGVRYGFQGTASETKSKCSDVEILSETSFLPCVSVLDTASSELSETVAVPMDGYLDKDALFNSLLPEYKNLSNEVDSVANGPGPKKKSNSKSPAVAKVKGFVENTNSEGPNHTVNSCVDSDSSDNSSVIDVETVVDDEINEFVLKRKLLQNSSTIEQGVTPKRSKKS